mmetsp:Transcript_40091/g.87566  ORF Transcript_40091/g.87566 Transcript_40091/m.87566 type:complete len:209 (-) Transcript_40091:49-675(-)
MASFRPLSVFCGLPLTMGVLIAAAETYLRAAILLCSVSSKYWMTFGELRISPMVQTMMAAAGLLGVPVCTMAMVGTIFRIEKHVWRFHYYMVVSWWVDVFWAIRLLIQGSLCSKFADRYILRRGPVFVCFFVGLGTVFWILVYLLFKVYLIFVVGSQAEILRKGEYADLLGYDGPKNQANVAEEYVHDSDHGGFTPWTSRPVAAYSDA